MSRTPIAADIEPLASSEAWRSALAAHGWSDRYLAGPGFRAELRDEVARTRQALNETRPPTGDGSYIITIKGAPAPPAPVNRLPTLPLAISGNYGKFRNIRCEP